jgi:hypothetical protein
MELIRVSLFAVVVLSALFVPPAWWYHRGRRPGERRKKLWGAIRFGWLMLASLGRVEPTAKGDWTGWLLNVARLEVGIWAIAIGAKGSPA